MARKNHTRSARMLTAAALFAFAPIAANASTIVMETDIPGGDFGDSAATATLLGTDVWGVTGSITGIDGADYFTFDTAPGDLMFDYEWTNNGGNWEFGFIIDGNTTLQQSNSVPGDNGFFAVNGFAGGEITIFSLYTFPGNNLSNTVNYAVNLQEIPMSEVPVPGAALLFGSGIAAFGAVRRRKKAQS